MTRNHELWDLAVHVLRRHGEEARDVVCGRVAALAEDGDEAAIQTWLSIASRVDALLDGSERAPH